MSQVSTSAETIAIVGATLIDGSGGAPVRGAVVILKGDEIIAVGRRGSLKVPRGARIIDARGLVLAPGFIDTHNHSGGGFARDPSAATQVSQGITTVLLGQDGGSEYPIAEYLTKLEQSPVAVNVLTMIGHATLRSRVMKSGTNRAATIEEIAEMTKLMEQGMRDGAFGLSSGLEYEVGKRSTTEEVISLARAAGKYQGLYMSHIRDEADLTMEAIAEAIRIGREGQVPAQISHIKLGSAAVWGRAGEVVALVEQARRAGQDVTADCYPYNAWSSTIKVLVPSDRHDDPAAVAKGLADVGGAQNVTIVNCQAHPDYEFKTLAQIAVEKNLGPAELYTQIVKDGGAGIVCHSMKDEDIRAFYQQPWVMVSSDGGIGMRHPRGAGAFPRVLGLFVRERRWLTLSEAVRKMTSLPAKRLGLRDRGLIRRGFKADLVLLDPARVKDNSTFREPHLISDGIAHVFVNGVEVWRQGAVTKAKPGRPLRRDEGGRMKDEK
ncbi:MAG: D-aminoacylase [Pyrinomonadaceae bacterium]